MWVCKKHASVRLLSFQMSAYRVAEAAIDDRTELLGELGQFIWKNPELGFEETKAHDYIATYLESEGFRVTRNYILPTAFRAEFGGKLETFMPSCFCFFRGY